MSEKNQYLSYLSEFAGKYGAWMLYIFIGMLGKFGMDILNEKKINKWYFVGYTFVALFVGFVSSMWFINNQPKAGPYIIPILTLCSRDLLVIVTLIDWRKKISRTFKVDIKKEEL